MIKTQKDMCESSSTHLNALRDHSHVIRNEEMAAVPEALNVIVLV